MKSKEAVRILLSETWGELSKDRKQEFLDCFFVPKEQEALTELDLLLMGAWFRRNS